MACPKCGGILVVEDRVRFCEDCLHVIDRSYASDFPKESPVKAKPKSLKRKKKWPRWRKLKIDLTKAAKGWMPGQRLTYHPAGIRATICVSKNGTTYYNYYKHKHKL